MTRWLYYSIFDKDTFGKIFDRYECYGGAGGYNEDGNIIRIFLKDLLPTYITDEFIDAIVNDYISECSNYETRFLLQEYTFAKQTKNNKNPFNIRIEFIPIQSLKSSVKKVEIKISILSFSKIIEDTAKMVLKPLPINDINSYILIVKERYKEDN